MMRSPLVKLKYLVWSVGLCGALILSGGCAQSRKLMGFERPVSDPSQVMIEKDLVIPPYAQNNIETVPQNAA